jgi:hypothetical protein
MWDWAINEVQQRPAVGGAALAVLLAALGFGYRLLAEAQRRSTLAQVANRAPGGTVIMQEKSPAGPAMWIWVGTAPPATAYRGEYVIVVVAPPTGPAWSGLPGGRSSRDA